MYKMAKLFKIVFPVLAAYMLLLNQTKATSTLDATSSTPTSAVQSTTPSTTKPASISDTSSKGAEETPAPITNVNGTANNSTGNAKSGSITIQYSTAAITAMVGVTMITLQLR